MTKASDRVSGAPFRIECGPQTVDPSAFELASRLSRHLNAPQVIRTTDATQDSMAGGAAARFAALAEAREQLWPAVYVETLLQIDGLSPCDILITAADDRRGRALVRWLAADPEARIQFSADTDRAEGAASSVSIAVSENYIRGAVAISRCATTIAEALRALLFLPICEEAIEAMDWAGAAIALDAAARQGKWASGAFRAFVRSVHRRPTPIDSWRLDVAVAHIQARGRPISADRHRHGPIRGPIPSLGTDEPDPHLRAWACVRTIMEMLERCPQGGRSRPEVKEFIESVDGAKLVWWWLTGDGAPANEDTALWHWTAAAERVAASLAPLQLISMEHTQLRTQLIADWQSSSGTYIARRTLGNTPVNRFLTAWNEANEGLLSRALHICRDQALAGASEMSKRSLIQRAVGVVVACRDTLRADSGPEALADWCVRAIALGMVGEVISATGRPQFIVNLCRDVVVAHIGLLESVIRLADVPLRDDLVGFPLWWAIKTVLRDRVQADDIGSVTTILGHAAETGSLSTVLAKHSAAAAQLASKSPAEAASRAMLLRLVVTTLDKSDANWGKLRKRVIADRWIPVLTEAEAAPSLAESLRDLLEPTRFHWTVARFLERTAELAGPDLPTEEDAVSAAVKWWTGRAPPALLGGLNLGELIEDARAGRGMFAAEASAIEARLWPQRTADWFEDGSLVGHSLPESQSLRSATAAALREYLNEAFAPLLPPQSWFSSDELPHLFEDLRHLVGSRSSAQGNGERSLSLGNIVILLGVALGARMAAGWPRPAVHPLERLRWTPTNRRNSAMPPQGRETARRTTVGLVRDVLMPRCYRDHAASQECVVSEVLLSARSLQIVLEFSCLEASGGPDSWVERIVTAQDRGIQRFFEDSRRQEDRSGRPIAVQALCSLGVAPCGWAPSWTTMEFVLLPTQRGAASLACPVGVLVPVLVVDTVERRRTSHLTAFAAVGARPLCLDGLGKIVDPLGSNPSQPDQFALTVVHGNDAALLAGLPTKPGTVIRYSGGSIPPETEEGPDLWITLRPISETAPLTAGEAAVLVTWVSRGSRAEDAPHLIRRRQAPSTSMTALALACQGYLAVYATSTTTPSPTIVRALNQMGWPLAHHPDSLLRPVGLEWVSTTQWWKECIGDLAPSATMAPPLELLLRAIMGNDPITPDLVARAYSSLLL